MSRRATSYDVARLAGVSQSAVSRCFTNGASIAPSTRSKVLQAARELGYVPNRMAQGLSTRRSSLIAVLLPSVVNLYFPELLGHLASALEKHDLRPLLFIREDGHHNGQLVAEALGHAVDGLISALALDKSALAPALDQQLPVVMLNRDGHAANVSSVTSDHGGGARAIADRLIDAHCQRIALVDAPEQSPTGRWRSDAFRDQIERRGRKVTACFRGDYTFGAGQQAARQLLDCDQPPDGLFCANDAMAMGVLDTARLELGFDIPGQLKIVGFDDLMASNWPSYQLSTVRQRVDLLSEAVADRMASLILNPQQEARHDLIGCEFVQRRTC